MRRLVITAVGVALLAGACAPTGGGSPPPTSSAATPASPPTATTAPSPTPTGRTLALEVWFERDGALFVTTRSIPATVAVGAASLDALFAGPSAPEAAAGVATAVPSGIRLLDLSIANGTARADLSPAFAASPATRTAARMRVAQVVQTLTQFPTVSRVRLLVDGAPVSSIGGFRTDRSLDRAAFSGLLPPILVQSPTIGALVTSPVRVAGTANVFEGTVSIRVLDAQGRTLASTFTTATCGTGCRGTFAKLVAFRVTSRQAGTVVAYEVSMENGAAIHVQRIPVTLSP